MAENTARFWNGRRGMGWDTLGHVIRYRWIVVYASGHVTGHVPGVEPSYVPYHVPVLSSDVAEQLSLEP